MLRLLLGYHGLDDPAQLIVGAGLCGLNEVDQQIGTRHCLARMTGNAAARRGPELKARPPTSLSHLVDE